MLTLILIEVQYLHNVVFSFEKSSNGQDTTSHRDLSKQFSCPVDGTKKLNLLIKFSNSIFKKIISKHIGIELAFKIN